jgi:hypothetical protein
MAFSIEILNHFIELLIMCGRANGWSKRQGFIKKFLIATHYPGLYGIAYSGSPLFQKWRGHGA